MRVGAWSVRRIGLAALPADAVVYKENERFFGGRAKLAHCGQTPHGNPLRK